MRALRPIATIAFACASILPASARAQVVVPLPAADPVGRLDSMSALTLEPLRLSLFGQHPVVPANECGDQLAETQTGGSPMRQHRAFGVNLLGGSSSWQTPKLTLFGFSRSGCALDAAVGGGITFLVPIKPNVAFSLGGGAIYLPQTLPGTKGPGGGDAKSGTVRADVVIRRPNGNAFMIGVGSLPKAVTFGGLF